MSSTSTLPAPLRLFVYVLDGLGCKPKRGSGLQYRAHCPGHDDKVPSLSFGWSDRRRCVVVTCHAGCERTAILKAMGIPWELLFEDGWGVNGSPSSSVMGKGFRTSMALIPTSTVLPYPRRARLPHNKDARLPHNKKVTLPRLPEDAPADACRLKAFMEEEFSNRLAAGDDRMMPFGQARVARQLGWNNAMRVNRALKYLKKHGVVRQPGKLSGTGTYCYVPGNQLGGRVCGDLADVPLEVMDEPVAAEQVPVEPPMEVVDEPVMDDAEPAREDVLVAGVDLLRAAEGAAGDGSAGSGAGNVLHDPNSTRDADGSPDDQANNEEEIVAMLIEQFDATDEPRLSDCFPRGRPEPSPELLHSEGCARTWAAKMRRKQSPPPPSKSEIELPRQPELEPA